MRQVWEEPITFRWVLGAYEYGLNLALYQTLQLFSDMHFVQLTHDFSRRSSASTHFDDSSSQDSHQDDEGSQDNSPFFEAFGDMEIYDESEQNNCDELNGRSADELVDQDDVGSQRHMSNVWQKRDSRRDYYRSGCLLFGVEGCGKPRKVFEYLTHNFGFYILPGCELPDDRIGQADTELLYRFLARSEDHSSGIYGFSYKSTGIDERGSLYEYWVETFIGLKFWLFKNSPKSIS